MARAVCSRVAKRGDGTGMSTEAAAVPPSFSAQQQRDTGRGELAWPASLPRDVCCSGPSVGYHA